jgi:hypothetical protein
MTVLLGFVLLVMVLLAAFVQYHRKSSAVSSQPNLQPTTR